MRDASCACAAELLLLNYLSMSGGGGVLGREDEHRRVFQLLIAFKKGTFELVLHIKVCVNGWIKEAFMNAFSILFPHN